MYYIDLAVTGLSFGCMYAMMAVGLTLVYGLLRILHVAHAAVFALGAYLTVIVANATGSIGLGFLAAIAVTPLFGMAVYRLLYEPLLSYRPDVPMIASVGLLVFMQDAFRIAFGEQGVTFKNNIYAFKIYDVAGVRVNAVQVALSSAPLVVFVGLHLLPRAPALASPGGLRYRGRRSPRALASMPSKCVISISPSARRSRRWPAALWAFSIISSIR